MNNFTTLLRRTYYSACCMLLIIFLLIPSLAEAQTLPNRYLEDVFTTFETTNVRFGTNIPKVRTTPQLNPFAPFFSLTASLISPNEGDMTTQQQNLDMNIFRPVGDTLTKRPVVVICFGGGFIAGSRADADIREYAERLARRGFVTAAIDYRLGMNIFNQDAAFRAVYRAVQDGRQAVRFFRANAATYGIDPDQVYIGGHSAGGFVSLHNIHLDKVGEIPPQTQFVPSGTYGNSNNWPSLGGLDGVGANTAFDGKANLAFAWAGALGFLSYIEGPDDAPMLQFHSEDDGTVLFGVGAPFPDLDFLADLPTVHGGGSTHPYALSVDATSVFYDTTGLGHNPHTSTAANRALVRDRIGDFMYEERLKPYEAVITGDDELCLAVADDSDNIRTYTLDNADNFHYEWFVTGGTFVTPPTIFSTEVTVKWDTPGIGELGVWLYQRNLARSREPVMLEVNVIPNISITCPADITVAADAGGCTASVTVPVPTTAGCTMVSLTNDFNGTGNASDTYSAGVNAVTWTATDAVGNTATCTMNITVTDDIDPVAVCQNITIALDADGNATIVAAALDGGSTDNCSIASFAASETNFTCADIGDNTVTLTVTDGSGNTDECDAIVTVEDTLAPNAVCQNITIALNASGNASITAADIDNGSTDNCSVATLAASQTSFTCADVGANTVTLTVTDGSGNSSTCTATVTVEDNIAPTAVCQNLSLTLTGTSLTINAADLNDGSTDNCSIASYLFDDTGEASRVLTCTDFGTTTLTLRVTDAAGNSSTCTADVTLDYDLILSYSGEQFNESPDDDGSIDNTIMITANCDIFGGADGDDFVAAGWVTVLHTPAGLTPVITRVNASTLTFSLTGNAAPHDAAANVDNLTVNFSDAAFAVGTAADVTNAIKDDLRVRFDLPTGGGSSFTPPVPMQPAQSFTAIAQSTNSILLNWRASPDNPVRYVIYRRADGETEWTRIARLNPSAREFIDENLEQDTRYFYSLIALRDTERAETRATEVTYPEKPTVSMTQNACNTDFIAKLRAEGEHQNRLFRWYLQAEEGSIIAENLGSFTTPTLSEAKTYYVSALGQKYESQERAAITVEIIATPTAEFTSLSTDRFQYSCGEEAILEVADQGEGVTYRWLRNGQRIAETEEPRFEATEEGAYQVIISRGSCAAVSQNVLLKLNYAPHAEVLGTNLRFCEEGVLSAAAVEGATYEWFKDGESMAITEANRLEISETGNYSVKVMKYGCENISVAKFAEVLPLPETVTLEVSNASLCPDEPLLLTATEVEGATYRWARNGRSIGFSETNTLRREGGGTYSVQISYPGFSCFRRSEEVQVDVLDMPIVRVLKDGSELVLTPERNEPIANVSWYYELRGERQPLPEYENELRIIPTLGTGFYGANVIYQNGCEMEAVANRFFAEGGITGNEPEAPAELRIYPNPASSIVTIADISRVFTNGDLDIEVYDAIGRVVMRKQFTQNELQGDIQLNIGNLANGSYTLRLNGETQVVIKKLIKE
ncbi:MAG: carboxylesterase family protein [Bernardetiaceae bacterium]|nr:carboxylesterase family protein [Bernardetiaceae bacterium]